MQATFGTELPLPGIDAWTSLPAHRDDGVVKMDLASGVNILTSPPLELEADQLYVFVGEIEIAGAGRFRFGIIDVETGRWASHRLYSVRDKQPVALTFRPSRPARFACALQLLSRSSAEGIELRHFQPKAYHVKTRALGGGPAEDTHLPSWGPIKRFLHRQCKQSRAINGLVAMIELRLGRDELISLPQYMSLCPTGQCNARCDFCSVTINRTGIIKKQLPFERLNSFVAPVARTIRMFGIEGNGEPTLYRQLPELVDVLTAGGSDAYLITNGTQTKLPDVPLLLALESVNFSLNSCTADVHQKVMKLKNFDAVVATIKRLVRIRGYKDGKSQLAPPRVSVSFVVTNDNVHTVADFLHFAEQELGVDVIFVRPLSELGNEQGTVEDFRDIVPYQSDIDDMVEAVHEYLGDVERRADIRVDPETFRAFRPDPVDGVLRPRGYERRLLSPRRGGWLPLIEGLQVSWSHARATIEATGAEIAPGPFWRSCPIPVERGRPLRFHVDCQVQGGPLAFRILAEDGTALAQTTLNADGRSGERDVTVDTGSNHSVRLEFSHLGGPLAFSIDFGRVRKPAPFVSGRPTLPSPERWEICLPDVAASWSGSRLHLTWQGQPGLYLLKSYTIPCSRAQAITIPAALDIRSGRLGIGILSEDFSRWLSTFEFDTGRRTTALAFNSGSNSRVQLVLYALSPESIDAEIDWTEAYALPDLCADSTETARVVAIEATPARATQEQPSVVQSLPRPVTPASSERPAPVRTGTGKRRIYCHKPWTDLHSFSVDGRMDVCCIATGESQKRYQLGNLLTEKFQDVWNGPQAREFRRTVNSGKPLPPCARCPMSHAYQGLWFDPLRTLDVFRHYLLLPPLARTRGGRHIAMALDGMLKLLLGKVLFRQFRLPESWPKVLR